MTDPPAERHGGQILVDQLRIQGCDTVFCVPGESFLAALDGLYDSGIHTIVCRQEGGAAMMAEAYGKLTGRPGVCFVTRAPGATNAASGVHVALQDSTSLILFVGQVGSDTVDRESFQEVDYRRMFAPLAKWAAQIDRTERIPEYVSHAYHLATSGRPGPIVLALPEDMLSARARAADCQPAVPVVAHPSDADLRSLGERLSTAERPLVILGGPGWTARACAQMTAFAERLDLPVGTAFRCQDRMDNRHPNYVGDVGIGINPKLAARVREADLLLVVGARLGEMTTSGYSLVEIPNPRQSLVHVHPGAEELGRVYRPDLAINAAVAAFAAGLERVAGPERMPWSDWTRTARTDYEAFIEPQATPGAVQLEQVVAYLRERLPGDAIVTNGAGNCTAWLHRYYQFSHYGTQLAPTSGSMGYGLPAAIAAKLAAPERTVVCLAGDGCFMMTGQELATAMLYRLPVVVLVANNGMYGTIRMHQERHYPGRVSGTLLHNPDFAALARAHGAFGERIEHTGEFPEAFERALAARRPAVIELPIDPDALTPRQTLSSLAEAKGA